MYFAGLETRENDGLRFTSTIERIQVTIANQLGTHITLLEGTSGLFAASDLVSINEFQVYIDRLNLRRQYPGIHGIGYIESIPSVQKETLTSQLQAEGLTDFLIQPESTLPQSNPVIYFEPSEGKNSRIVGYDMETEPIRRKTMNEAVLSGKATMSEKVPLLQMTEEEDQAGFLIFLPVFSTGIVPPTPAERQENLLGFIYSPFHADDFLRSVVGAEKSPQVDFRVYDGDISSGNLLHDSRNFGPYSPPSYAPRFQSVRRINAAGHTWTIEYTTNQAFDTVSDIWLVPFVFIFGLLTSGVLFILSKAQYEAGRKAEVSEGNLHFIADTGKVLASSLEYKKTISTVVKMGTIYLADWCAVEVKKGKEIEQIALAHRDPEKIKWAKRYRKLNPPDLKEKNGIAQVIRTGKSELYPVITEKMLLATVRDAEQAELIRSLNISSVMVVPLQTHNKTIGAMTFISTNPKRRYTQSDVSVAEEIAQRAAMAIEHARLYAESEHAVKLRDDFISVASHELKTPVTSMKMYLQVIRRQLDKKGEKELSLAMGKIGTQVDKLTLLIQDLLNVSRIQIGRLDFHDEWFDLNGVVSDLVESIRPTTRKHSISIHGTVKKKIYGDKDRIGQVLINFLTNAIKYSPDAHKVEVWLSEDKESITVQVKDYGIGIDEKYKDKIFNRFYRVSDSDEKTYPGLGIGLFISHEIIHRHGGKVTVESEKGKGSTFGFTLPKKKKPGKA